MLLPRSMGCCHGNVESRTGFCLRRRAWHSMLMDLDNTLKLPDVLLAQQILACANITYDHQLMIRTTLGSGQLTTSSVMDELIAQHARVHEHELKRDVDFGRGRGFGQGGRFPSRSSKPWQSFHADEDAANAEWEASSQSLGGFEDDATTS